MAQPTGTAKAKETKTPPPDEEATPPPAADEVPAPPPAPAAGDERPILDVSNIIPEAVPVEDDAYVTLNDERYFYARITAWSLRERRAYTSRMERIFKLEEKADPDEHDEDQYRFLLLELAEALVPGLPKPLAEKLDNGQLTDLAMAFFVWIGENHPRMAMTGRLGRIQQQLKVGRNPSIGARSSRASSASTEETPDGG